MILAFLLIVTSILVFKDTGKNHSESLEQIMVDIYAPRTMEQFTTSYIDNLGTVFNKTVADKLYVTIGTELNEQDLQRACTAQAYRSKAKDNSEGVEIYVVDALFNNASTGISKRLEYEFKVGDDNLIYTYTLNVTDY